MLVSRSENGLAWPSRQVTDDGGFDVNLTFHNFSALIPKLAAVSVKDFLLRNISSTGTTLHSWGEHEARRTFSLAVALGSALSLF